jgi:hypothetical protein
MSNCTDLCDEGYRYTSLFPFAALSAAACNISSDMTTIFTINRSHRRHLEQR